MVAYMVQSNYQIKKLGWFLKGKASPFDVC